MASTGTGMNKESFTYLLLHDRQRAPRRFKTLTDIINSERDVTLIYSDNHDYTQREIERGRDIYVLNLINENGVEQLLRSLATAERECRGNVILLGKEPTLDELLDAKAPSLRKEVKLSQTLNEKYEFKYVRAARSYLLTAFSTEVHDAIHRARNQRISILAAQGVNIDDYLKRALDSGQLAELALSMYVRAIELRDAARHLPIEAEQLKAEQTVAIGNKDFEAAADFGERATILEEQVKRIDEDRKRCEQDAQRWMRIAYDESPEGKHHGKITFGTQVSEGGGVAFRLTFVRHRDEAGARYLATVYNGLRDNSPGFHIPGPDPRLGEYPIITLDENRTIIASENIPGPTPRDLLRNRKKLLNNQRESDEKKAFADQLCDRMRDKLLRDLAGFVTTMPKLDVIQPCNDKEEQRELVSLFSSRLEDAAGNMLAMCSEQTRTKALRSYHEAISSMDPFDPIADQQLALRVNVRTLVPHRDSIPANMTLRRDGRLPPETSELEHLYRKLHRPPTMIARETNALEVQEARERRRIDKYLQDRMYHYDFGYRRAMPTLWGEDFFQLMLDPDWDLVYGEHDAKLRNEAFENLLEIDLYKYCIYETLAEHNGPEILTRVNDEFPSSDNRSVAEASRLIDLLQKQGIREKESGFSFQRFFGGGQYTDAYHRTTKFLKRFNGRMPQSYENHLDWMRYYRAMRGASLSLTTWKKNTPASVIKPMIEHYARASIAPIERLRRRFFDHAQSKGLFSERYHASDFVPAHELPIEDILEDFENDFVPHLHHTPSDKTELTAQHFERLNYLVALSQKFVEYASIGGKQ